MRRTWNSWTYYGDRYSGGRKNGSVCRECGKTVKQRPNEVGVGSMEGAFEQSMADALERAMDRCEVRQERVARLKRAIEAGTYWVPAEELARKLVRNMLGDYR